MLTLEPRHCLLQHLQSEQDRCRIAQAVPWKLPIRGHLRVCPWIHLFLPLWKVCEVQQWRQHQYLRTLSVLQFLRPVRWKLKIVFNRSCGSIFLSLCSLRSFLAEPFTSVEVQWTLTSLVVGAACYIEYNCPVMTNVSRKPNLQAAWRLRFVVLEWLPMRTWELIWGHIQIFSFAFPWISFIDSVLIEHTIRTSSFLTFHTLVSSFSRGKSFIITLSFYHALQFALLSNAMKPKFILWSK